MKCHAVSSHLNTLLTINYLKNDSLNHTVTLCINKDQQYF